MSLSEVEAQYSQPDLLETILEALRAAGSDPDHLTVEEVARFDHFHTLGPMATAALADAAGLAGGEEVLDVGSGLGGPARMLASKYGCRVTAVDLSDDYCRVAAELDSRVGLTDRIVVQQGNAEALPLADRSFDVVWAMHVAMSIEDKARFYNQLARVLKPSGKLAFFELIAGEGDPYYPVPWADGPSISFLVDENELRLLLSEAGFHITVWEDVTAEGAAFFEKFLPSPVGLHRVLEGMQPKMANLGRSLAEGRVRAIRCVCKSG